MKKNYLFGLISLFTVLFAASCQEEDVYGGASDANTGMVTFKVNTQQVGTRAATGEGALADSLYYGVYEYVDKEWSLVEAISKTAPNSAQPISLEGTVVNIRLAKQKQYSVIFWAQSDSTMFDVNWEEHEIRLKSPIYANAEGYDAFWACDTVTLTGALSKEINLVRPFAQLNIGISNADLKAAQDASVNVVSSAVTVKGVPTSMDLMGGTVADAAVDNAADVANYALNTIPDSAAWTFPVPGYKYLALNYVLVGSDKSLTNVELSYKDSEGLTYSNVFTDVPVRRNYRTNIYGDLLTNEAGYTVNIEAGIAGSYNPEDMLKDALINGGKFTLLSDMTLPEGFTIPEGKNVEIDLNDNTLTIDTENKVKGNLSINNGNVVVDVEEEGDLLPAFTAYNGAKVDLNNANINLAGKNALVVVADSEVAATINVNKTTITGASGSVTHGISMPFGAKDIKINITESTLTGDYALYLYETNSVVTIDDKSLVKDFWIMGGKVDIAYTGTKPVVKIDGLAAEVNFYSQNEYPLHAALAEGGTITLTEDVVLTQPIALAAGVEATLNLNGKTISGNFTDKDNEAVIYNNGTLTLTGGTIKNDAVNGAAAINNSGELTLDDVTVQGAPIGTEGYPSYAVYSSGELTIEEGTTISSDRGAINLQNGANVTINGGNFEVTNAVGSRTLTAHVIYAYGSSSKLTINGGDFAQNIANGGGTSVICPAGATIKVYGGNFYHEPVSDVQSGCFQNYMGYGAPVDVYGGTYNDNTVTKSGNLAEGYKAIESNGKFVVVPEAVDAVASSASEVSAAIAAGNTVMLTGDVTYNTEITKDAEINLNGNTFEAAGTINLGNNADLTMIGGNYEVNGTSGHVDVRPNTAEGSVVVYKDVDFSFNQLGPTYGPSTNRLGSVVEVCATATGANTKIRFEGCTFDNAMVLFEGLSGTVGTFEAEFVNCTFNALTSSAPIYVQNYVEGTITLTGCTFNLECTSSSASAVSVSSSSSTSVTINAENNTINATAATPYTYDSSKGETEVHNVKVNGTPAAKFISCSATNTTVSETGTTKTGIAQ